MNISLGCQFVQSSSPGAAGDAENQRQASAANWRLSDKMLAILDSSPILRKYLDRISNRIDVVWGEGIWSRFKFTTAALRSGQECKLRGKRITAVEMQCTHVI